MMHFDTILFPYYLNRLTLLMRLIEKTLTKNILTVPAVIAKRKYQILFEENHQFCEGMLLLITSLCRITCF